MKIRFGFVSNSSSASFVLEVRYPKEDFINLLLQEFPQYFDKANFKRIILKRLNSTKQDIPKFEKMKEEIEEDKKAERKFRHSFMDMWLTRAEGDLLACNKLLSIVDELSDKQLIYEVLKFHNYLPPYENALGDISIGGHTDMWNDESDMGPLLESIWKRLDNKYRHIKHRIQVYND